ncbi:hypothetical protein HYX11_02995 [Candidatus Woesearchaeota archaeon]|nr:hypothetical protein [Candidatus Woesearchaeota archaeon]
MISIQESGLQTILETSELVFYDPTIISTPKGWTINLIADDGGFADNGRNYYEKIKQRDNFYKQVLLSILPDYVVPGDTMNGSNNEMCITRVFPTEHEKYNLHFEMRLTASNKKKEEIVGVNFFKSLTQTDKLLIKSASITEVSPKEDRDHNNSFNRYYLPLFKFPFDNKLMNIIITSILNGQTVTNTIKQMNTLGKIGKYGEYIPGEIPITSPCGQSQKQVYVAFNILNPTSCRVNEAAIDYHKFMDYLRTNLECCAEAGIFLHVHNKLLYAAKEMFNNKNKKEIEQKASDSLSRADELVQKINSDTQKFSSLQNLTLLPKTETRN